MQIFKYMASFMLAFVIISSLQSVLAQDTPFCVNNPELVLDEVLRRKVILANSDNILGLSDEDIAPFVFRDSESTETTFIDSIKNIFEIAVDCTKLENLPFSTFAFDRLNKRGLERDLGTLREVNEDFIHYFLVTVSNNDDGQISDIEAIQIEDLPFLYIVPVASTADFQALLSDPDVVHIMEDAPLAGNVLAKNVVESSDDTDGETGTAEGFLGSAPFAYGSGTASAGQEVPIVIIDFGVKRELFINNLKDVHCFSSQRSISKDSELKSEKVCGDEVNSQVIFKKDGTMVELAFFASKENVCESTCYHGSIVAQLAVGAKDSDDGMSHGMAPEASIYSIQTSSYLPSMEIYVIYRSDVLRALWHLKKQNIERAVINMSLDISVDELENWGISKYTRPCDSEPANNPLGILLGHLSENEDFVIVASGNAGYKPSALDVEGGVSWPACATRVARVAASQTRANRSSHHELWGLEAPGGEIFEIFGGGTICNDITIDGNASCSVGTSWAAALVSGAVAACLSGNFQPHLPQDKSIVDEFCDICPEYMY